MNEGWIVLGICLAFVLGVALPLISKRGADKTPPPPRKPPVTTASDWKRAFGCLVRLFLAGAALFALGLHLMNSPGLHNKVTSDAGRAGRRRR